MILSSFCLSALILAAVHSFSRSLRSARTLVLSFGGAEVASSSGAVPVFSFRLSRFEFGAGVFEFRFELSRSLRWIFALAVARFLFEAARIMFGIRIAATIPSPTMPMNATARMPTTLGQTFRLVGRPGDTDEPGG